jgi:putative peptidoglycan lipid II flippase
MLKSILSVGSFTLLSRITGLVRDIMMAAILGAGPIMDAFSVAFRLPNHFRVIFAEGAFNAAFVPNFTKILTQEGEDASKRFQARVLTWLILSQIILLIPALIYTEQFVKLFLSDSRLALATDLTRITFPYLFLIALVTLWGGVLNASNRFAAAAAAPILLNVSIIATLSLYYMFPTSGHAAAWGVLISGALQALFLCVAVRRANLFVWPATSQLTQNMGRFFKSFGPAVIGSAGVQIAMLIDTIIASSLPTGALSAIWYADRLYQLPVGVIAIAGGTVLLPTMSKLLAKGQDTEAYKAQNRTAALILALAAPCVIAFLTIADVLLAGLFQRQAFDENATLAASSVLKAYGVGLPAIVLIRVVLPSFQARGDTKTPMIISLIAIIINIVLKLILTGEYGAAGLAFATSVGAWINLGLLCVVAMRRGLMRPDRKLFWMMAVIGMACLWLLAIMGLEPFFAGYVKNITYFSKEIRMLVISAVGMTVYFGALALGLKVLKLRV